MPIAQVVRLSGLASLASSFDAAISGFLSYCRAKNLSPHTVEYYDCRLRAFRQYLDALAPGMTPLDVTTQVIRVCVAQEAEARSPSTANHTVVTLRALFNYLGREGFLEANPMAGVEKLRQKRKVIETFTTDQVQAVLATCGKDFTGVRDRAIILTLLDCGLRVSELCGLSVEDLSWTEQTMLVCGKGNRERVVPFGQNAKQALLQYTARRGELPNTALFVNHFGNGIDRFRVREIIFERCKAAGIVGVRRSPHTFRHTFAVSYLRNGGDVFSLQKMLGHSGLEMTRRYADLADADVVEKHQLFSPGDRLQTAKPTKGRKRLR